MAKMNNQSILLGIARLDKGLGKYLINCFNLDFYSGFRLVLSVGLSLVVNTAHAIVGGEDSLAAAYPSFVVISVAQGPTSTGICGGAFIDKEWVMTSAHCVSNNPSHTPVDASRVNVNPNPQGFVANRLVADDRMAVSQIVVHPNYNRTTSSSTFNDIALLKLATPHNYPNAVLNGSGDVLASRIATVAGMGSTSVSPLSITNPRTLQMVDLPIVDYAQCQTLFGYDSPPTLCAGDTQAKDICYGDTGAPLYIKQNGINVQAGIASFLVGGCASGNPSGYTDVASYESFILQHASGAQFVTNTSVAALSAVSGAWYDPVYSGLGINIIRPDANRLLAYYYGYKGTGDGQAQWLMAELNGQLSDARIVKDAVYTFTVYQGFLGNGADFSTAPSSPPGIEVWGTMTLQFHGCNRATMTLDGKDGQVAFQLVKLANEYNLGCTVQ
ncbi:S1 family peptidase [Ostreibacterium oceani]|nr:serine protease [Ostreibacterium oceani]